MSIATLVEESSTSDLSAAQRLLAGPGSSGAPLSWRTETQSAAWEKFDALPMPARTDEAWRFSTRKALDLSSFTAPAAVPAPLGHELVARSQADGLEAIAGRMVFANDQLLQREVLSESLKQKGVLWLPDRKSVV